MAIHVGNNFCIAAFTQLTFSPFGNYSPCPEIGGTPWVHTGHSIGAMWMSDEFQQLRTSFQENTRNPICDRCWVQEEHKKQSLRKQLFVMPHLKGNLVEFINSEYQDGPRQINLITSNMCNLRCRICYAGSSVTFNVEGEFYEKKNNIKDTRYVSKEKKAVAFSAQQINDIFDISKNLRRLEFYGGEPLLDKPTLMLLEKLVDSGRSQDITLLYNTNAVNLPIQRQYDLWNKFKSIEFNLSIDAIGDKFTYNRHPAKWEDALSVIDALKMYPWTIPVNLYAYCTTSSINVYDLPETIAECQRLNLKFHINNVNNPEYYDIANLPTSIKYKILKHLNKFPHYTKELEFIKNVLATETTNNQWELFKFWTHEKDSYRKESFKTIMPEYYSLLHTYDNTF